MERRAFAKILLLALLLTLPLPTMGAGAWYCEGRPCGVSLWLCCCVSPDGFRDVNCQQDAHAREKAAAEDEATLACATGCNCQIVLTAADAPGRAESYATFAVSAVAILLAPSLVPVPLFATRMITPIETRGPPVAPVSVLHLGLGLRAPPIA
jgi:hypothetical protein